MRGLLSIPGTGVGASWSTCNTHVWLLVLQGLFLADASGLWCHFCAAGAIPVSPHGLVVQHSPSACSCKRSLIYRVPPAPRAGDSRLAVMGELPMPRPLWREITAMVGAESGQGAPS